MPAPAIDRGDGRPVLLVHGQPGEGSDWEPLAALLEHQFRVIAPDRPGWGVEPDGAMDIAGNADWLETMLAGLTGSEPVIAVGHSFGGGVALALAVRHPERVRALVLVGSVGHRTALTRLDRLLARPGWGEAIVRVGTRAARGTWRVARRSLVRAGRAAAVVQRADRVSMLRVLGGAEPLPEGALASFSAEQRALVRETEGLEAALVSIEVPTVVLAGTRDFVVGVAASRALADAIPGAELVLVAGAGHLLPVEAPARLAEIVVRYDRLAGGVTAAPRPPAGPAA